MHSLIGESRLFVISVWKSHTTPNFTCYFLSSSWLITTVNSACCTKRWQQSASMQTKRFSDVLNCSGRTPCDHPVLFLERERHFDIWLHSLITKIMLMAIILIIMTFTRPKLHRFGLSSSTFHCADAQSQNVTYRFVQPEQMLLHQFLICWH